MPAIYWLCIIPYCILCHHLSLISSSWETHSLISPSVVHNIINITKMYVLFIYANSFKKNLLYEGDTHYLCDPTSAGDKLINTF